MLGCGRHGVKLTFMVVIVLVFAYYSNFQITFSDSGAEKAFPDIIRRTRFPTVNVSQLLVFRKKSVLHENGSLQSDGMGMNSAAVCHGRTLSTCSCQSDKRGLHQNVVAFSLYGDLMNGDIYNRYILLLREAIESIAKYYPDWIVRIYYSVQSPLDSSYQKLESEFGQYPGVDLCNATKVLKEKDLVTTTFMMNWRFLPLIDPTVDCFMSRDSDSPILKREVDAVEEWLKSESSFHIMRDHPSHCSAKILGGLWGVKLFQLRGKTSQAATKLLTKRTKHYKGVDQQLLRRFVWPLAKEDSLVHDSYCCNWYHSTMPFPSKRLGKNFTGMVFDDYDPVIPSCPKECRPNSHPDWTLC